MALLDDQEAMLEDETRLRLEHRASGGPPGLLRLARAATPTLAPGVAASRQRVGQTANRRDQQGIDILENMEDAQLMPRLRPQLGQDRRVEVGTIADDHAGQQSPALEIGQEKP